MHALSLSAWDARDSSVVAQVDIDADEIVRLGGVVERPDSESGQVETAVFGLDSGLVVLLTRVQGNPVAGFALLQAGQHPSSTVLEWFLRESGLSRDRVTWLSEPSEMP